MKIIQVNADNGIGGAARAAVRLHEGLKNTGISSTLFVRSQLGSDSSVRGPESFLQDGISRIRPYIASSFFEWRPLPGRGCDQ